MLLHMSGSIMQPVPGGKREPERERRGCCAERGTHPGCTEESSIAIHCEPAERVGTDPLVRGSCPRVDQSHLRVPYQRGQRMPVTGHRARAGIIQSIECCINVF